MCRHLAYLGPPVRLADLVLTPPHSLYRQSYAPGDMRGSALINADGFGAGWYPSGVDTPSRYQHAVPLWTDRNFRVLAEATYSGAVLAAGRSATAGMPIMDSA